MDKKNRILIVDDTVDTVELLKKRLRSEGYDTAEAHDGEECLRQVHEYNPDLIVLDVMMPKLNGYEVCRRLKSDKNTRYTPVLMLTAKSEVVDKIKGLDIGADDYITKPFDYKELSARIRSLLKIKTAHEKLVAEEKSGALDLMLDEIAHEVRNPLVSIGGFARRVCDNLPEGNLNKKYMEMILEDVVKLENMVRQLIEIKTSSLSYIEPANINDVIIKALDGLDEALEENAVNVETELMNDPPVIHVDKEQLQKAVSNLIKNSIEAMVNSARALRIISRVYEDGIEIQISDTGKGISREKIKNIFNPLFTSKIYGPGLGLPFALKIIQDHRGIITVESKPEQGSAFTIRLPIRKL